MGGCRAPCDKHRVSSSPTRRDPGRSRQAELVLRSSPTVWGYSTYPSKGRCPSEAHTSWVLASLASSSTPAGVAGAWCGVHFRLPPSFVPALKRRILPATTGRFLQPLSVVATLQLPPLAMMPMVSVHRHTHTPRVVSACRSTSTHIALRTSHVGIYS